MTKSKAKKISIYNHKGGVGKTTLTYNLASMLSDMGHKVLLVDTDPQCNLSGYVLDPEVMDDYLDKSDGLNGNTVWSCVKPVTEGSGAAHTVIPVELSSTHGGLYIIPGDIRLSDFEGVLHEGWRHCFERRKQGYFVTSSLAAVVDNIASSGGFDYVFFDTGPNIGPLNRVLLLNCDYFLVPVAYDLFSVRALKTLGRTMFNWIRDWQVICQLAPDEVPLLTGLPQYAGYIPQNFVIYRGDPASQHKQYASAIEQAVNSDLISILSKLPELKVSKVGKLGELKDFSGLVAQSQKEGVPLYKVKKGNAEQKKMAEDSIRAIAGRVEKLTG